MIIDRRSLIAAGLGAGLATRVTAQMPRHLTGRSLWAAKGDPEENIALWPKDMRWLPATPLKETVSERSKDPAYFDRAVFGISHPVMAVFRPVRPNGAAVMITPGGGYRWVVVDKEGYELGRWLSARGLTVFVLFYRLPGEGWAAGPDVVLQDTQRAMRLIRHRAADYRIDPERVAAMGFSAGGHACADLAARFATAVYTPVDKADRLSARPNVAAPIYPVISMSAPNAHAGSRERLIGANASPEAERAHSPHLNIPANAPPHFILHAEDDDIVPVENALLLRAALRAKNISVETHLFTHGGHGFGLRKTIGKPIEVWPEMFLAWAETQGLL
jgi:acetyl esterase/lipase